MTNLFKKTLLGVLLFSALFVFVAPTYAQLNTGIGEDGLAGQAASKAGYGSTDQFTLSIIIGTVVQFVFGFFGVLFTVLTVYAGYNWMTARGDESKVETAQNTIQQAVIGMVICFSGYAISNYVIRVFIG